MISDFGDAIEHDPEVRQARMVADAARTRLFACLTDPPDMIDLAEAQRMLDAFRNALAHAEEAEDRVLAHCGLLTSAEAGRRAARRRPVTSRADRPPRAVPSAAGVRRFRRPGAGRLSVRRVVACVLVVVAVAIVGVAVARSLGVRPPLARW